MSLTADLIAQIRAKPVADDDLTQAALFTLDAIACAYAGSATPVGKILRNWSAKAPRDDRRDAFLMGALTHITETDDLHRKSVTHPGCVVVPATLALGQRLGASPAQLLHAILQGFEAMCRVGAAVGPAHYRVWHNTATCGPFGSAMAAACLLQLNDSSTRDALGNAGTQASGFWEFMQSGAMSKHLHAGRAAESGLIAAELAAEGFTGPPEILEGKRGFFAAMCDDPVADNLLADAAAPWQLRLTSIKPWPSCRHTHPIIDCALELHGLLAGEPVQSIEIRTYQAALDVCDNPAPRSEYEAKFSLYHCAAVALLDGAVGLGSFDDTARTHTADLCARTRVEVVEPYRSSYPDAWGAEVRVETVSGQSLKVSRRDCRGDPELALSAAEMRAKAEGLLAFAGLGADDAARVCDAVLALPASESSPAMFSDFIATLDLPA
ncbi:MAG: MmgE/PrpD family protein [Gammaproteobacteria bacterium]|nr:MmgE/PrpD family protein [Gammaproteobacteria bacterium]